MIGCALVRPPFLHSIISMFNRPSFFALATISLKVQLKSAVRSVLCVILVLRDALVSLFYFKVIPVITLFPWPFVLSPVYWWFSGFLVRVSSLRSVMNYGNTQWSRYFGSKVLRDCFIYFIVLFILNFFIVSHTLPILIAFIVLLQVFISLSGGGGGGSEVANCFRKVWSIFTEKRKR